MNVLRACMNVLRARINVLRARMNVLRACMNVLRACYVRKTDLSDTHYSSNTHLLILKTSIESHWPRLFFI